MKRNQISICVNAGLYVLNCKKQTPFLNRTHFIKAENTYVKLQLFDAVSLVEALQLSETNGYDVVRIVQEAQMQHGKLVAIVAFAQQMSGSSSIIK